MIVGDHELNPILRLPITWGLYTYIQVLDEPVAKHLSNICGVSTNTWHFKIFQASNYQEANWCIVSHTFQLLHFDREISDISHQYPHLCANTILPYSFPMYSSFTEVVPFRKLLVRPVCFRMQAGNRRIQTGLFQGCPDWREVGKTSFV